MSTLHQVARAKVIMSLCLLLALVVAGCGSTIAASGSHSGSGPTATATPPLAPLAGKNMVPYLTGIAMVSASDGWITGYNDYYTGSAFLLHFQHGAWVRMPFPLSLPSPQHAYPTGIVMRSANDGWITGYTGASSTGGTDAPFLLHFTGGAWREAPPPSGVNTITALSMVSDTSGWALGAVNTTVSPETHILRYENGQWTTDLVVPGTVTSLSMDSGSDGWAAGGNLGATLLHYTGGSWVRVTPFSAREVTFITSVAMQTPDTGWATGVYQAPENCSECGGSPGQVVTLRYAGGTWRTIPPPSAPAIELRYTPDSSLPPFAIRSLVAVGTDAWLAHGPLVHYTSDGHATGETAGCQTDLISLAFVPGTTEAWVIGTNGQIYHYAGGALSRYDTGVNCPAA